MKINRVYNILTYNTSVQYKLLIDYLNYYYFLFSVDNKYPTEKHSITVRSKLLISIFFFIKIVFNKRE